MDNREREGTKYIIRAEFKVKILPLLTFDTDMKIHLATKLRTCFNG